MMRRFFVVSPLFPLVIICWSQPSTVDAFLAIHRKSDSNLLPMPQSTMKATTVEVSPVMLWVSNQGLDEDVHSASGKSGEGIPKIKSYQQEMNEARWQQFKAINNKFWDYTCNFLYVGISCLILLNVCGFGYTISAEEGLNVMPLNIYRQQRQWQEEVQRLQNQPLPQPLSEIQQTPDGPLLNNAKSI